MPAGPFLLHRDENFGAQEFMLPLDLCLPPLEPPKPVMTPHDFHLPLLRSLPDHSGPPCFLRVTLEEPVQ